MKNLFHRAMETQFPVTLLAPSKLVDDFGHFLNGPHQDTPFGSSFAVSPAFQLDQKKWMFLSACSAKRLEDNFSTEYSYWISPREVTE